MAWTPANSDNRGVRVRALRRGAQGPIRGTISMTRLVIVTALLLPIAVAQEIPPPPKPADDGPSLEATMKFIQDKLNEQGKVDYVVTMRNSRTNAATSDPSSHSRTIADLDANAASCTVSFSDSYVDEATRADSKIELSLREAEKLAVSPVADGPNKHNAKNAQ